jgi:hypothetical protein
MSILSTFLLPPISASIISTHPFIHHCYVCAAELRQLDLQRNKLSGTIPPSVGRLHNLLYLNIKDNEHMTGELPLEELLLLTKLNRLSLVHCHFQNAVYALEEMKIHLPRCKVWI